MLTTVLSLPTELDESIDEASPWGTSKEKIESRDLPKDSISVASKAYDILAYRDLVGSPLSLILVIFRYPLEVRCIVHHLEASDRTRFSLQNADAPHHPINIEASNICINIFHACRLKERTCDSSFENELHCRQNIIHLLKSQLRQLVVHCLDE